MTIHQEDAPALVAAVDWVLAFVLGSSATALSVLAIAVLGLLLLSGRLQIRRGIAVLLGNFILFAAGPLAGALTGGFAIGASDAEPEVIAPVQYTPAIPKAVPYDPYAGASVPTRPVDPLIVR